MAKKIDFKKAHYIIPIIILPFIFVFYFIFFRNSESEEVVAVVQNEGINTEIPRAKDNIETPDRLKAYQDAVKKRRMVTGMGDIEEEEEEKVKKEGQALKDSLSRAFKANAKTTKGQAALANRQQAMDAAKKSKDALMKIRNKSLARQKANKQNSLDKINSSGNKPMTNLKGASVEDRQMEAFKKQMRYIDSMENPQKYIAEAEALKAASEPGEKSVNVISKTNTVAENNNYFNTIKADLGKTMITAILDEGIKAWEGSRVRIRLLEPIFIDGRLLDKGQYLYGIVTGFKSQRLEIDVTSVVIQDEIVEMNVTLYDNDGIKGIYIPESSFRDFSKELGSNSAGSNFTMQQAPDNNSQAVYQSISKAVQTSTRAVQKMLRKNKARLKYNTQVFLVNTK